jgi:hypothetical protein
MGEKFRRNQNKGDNSEGDLHSLPPQAPPGNRLLPPLGRWSFPERAKSPDYIEIDAPPKHSECHHWDTDRVLVKSGCGTSRSHRDRGKSSQPDDQPHAAEGHNESTGALQHNEGKTG